MIPPYLRLHQHSVFGNRVFRYDGHGQPPSARRSQEPCCSGKYLFVQCTLIVFDCKKVICILVKDVRVVFIWFSMILIDIIAPSTKHLSISSGFTALISRSNVSGEGLRLGRSAREPEFPCPVVGELTHVHIIFSTADIGQQCYRQKVVKCISVTSRNLIIPYCCKDFVQHNYSIYIVDS